MLRSIDSLFGLQMIVSVDESTKISTAISMIGYYFPEDSSCLSCEDVYLLLMHTFVVFSTEIVFLAIQIICHWQMDYYRCLLFSHRCI